jgi:protein PhnA
MRCVRGASGGERNDRRSYCKGQHSNGAKLADGDAVTLIKDLKVKGTSETLKRGTLVKNIRLTGNPDEIECSTKQVKGLVLRIEFLKKA